MEMLASSNDNNLNHHLVVSLPFDSNPTYDECGLNYTTYGNPVIKDTSNLLDMNGNKPFKTALYCNGLSGISCTSTIPLGDRDFTISCWFYLTPDNIWWNNIFHFTQLGTSDQVRMVACHAYTRRSSIDTSVKICEDDYSSITYNRWQHIAYTYVHKDKVIYTYINGIKTYTKEVTKNRINYTLYLAWSPVGIQYWGPSASSVTTTPYLIGYIKHFKIYDGIAKWTTDTIDLKETYEAAGIKFTTKRNIYRLYNISYDSLYNYNINDYSLYNDTLRDIHNKLLYNNDTYRDINKLNTYNNDIYRSILRNYVYNNDIYRSILKDYIYNNDTLRDIHKINNYNNDTLRNVLYNINPLYKDTLRYIKRINKYNNITKRNIINNIQVLYNTKRLIHININIINYTYRKQVLNNNINNDTVRSVISWKHKIVAFITNPRYRLI